MSSSPAPHVEVLREGNLDGSGAILRLTTDAGLIVHTVAVPQEWYSPTGPTWIYIVEGEGLTLIDAGSTISVEALTSAFRVLGLDMGAVRRVVLTHGHIDHAGGAYHLVQATGAEIWAHALYELLRDLDSWESQGHTNPLMRRALEEPEGAASSQKEPSAQFRQGERYERHRRYTELRRLASVTRHIHDGEQAGAFTFFHTPGHSPDELTIALDSLMFSGDHVLPEITPHPTLKTVYPARFRATLPPEYQDERKHYGLDIYLRSLQRVAAYGDRVAVLPAHRLLNKGKLNLITAKRAQEIIQHHEQRMHRIASILGREARTMGDITKKLFSHRPLSEGAFHMALTEVVAHLEVMIDSGDVATASENRVHWLGTENFGQHIRELSVDSPPPGWETMQDGGSPDGATPEASQDAIGVRAHRDRSGRGS